LVSLARQKLLTGLAGAGRHGGRELKELFDPEYVLNPGVILNRDMDVHRKHLKPSPKASSLVDRCIECGFCESNCPAKDLSLTPRQRITVWKEIKRLEELPTKSVADSARLKDFKSLFNYYGEATCAADGMCQEKCPVKINTGEMIKQIRADEMQEGHPQANVRLHTGASPSLLPTCIFTRLLTVSVSSDCNLRWPLLTALISSHPRLSATFHSLNEDASPESSEQSLEQVLTNARCPYPLEISRNPTFARFARVVSLTRFSSHSTERPV
jgi:ferredoxin